MGSERRKSFGAHVLLADCLDDGECFLELAGIEVGRETSQGICALVLVIDCHGDGQRVMDRLNPFRITELRSERDQD